MRLLFAFLWLPLALCVALGAARGPVTDHLGLSLGLLTGAGLVWAVVLTLAPRVQASRGLVLWIVVASCLLRGVVLTGDPGTSDDLHRYAWEGALVLDGKSPYAFAPDDPALEAERERHPATWEGLNNRSISAAYPPVAQGAFALVVALSGGPDRAGPGLRTFFALADLVVLVPLAVLLRRSGRSMVWLAAWGWCPLVALEFAGAAHFDSLGILALVGGVALATGPPGHHARRGPLASALLTAGALVKILPLALVPFVLRRSRAWGRGLAAVAVVAVAAFLPLAFFEGGFAGLTRGVGEYGLRWEAASLVHRWIEPRFEFLGDYDGSWLDPRRATRALEGVLWLVFAAFLWRRRATPAGAALGLLGAFLVLSPTLHPWYVTWVVPFLALRPVPGLVFLTLAAPLLYQPLGGWTSRGEWVEAPWLWPVVALPTLGLLLFEVRGLRRPGAR